MPEAKYIETWTDTIHRRYENYLKTSFYFKDQKLRDSFQSALQEGGELLKGPFPEKARGFKEVGGAWALAKRCFHGNSSELEPALRERKDTLYAHQDRAVRAAYEEQRNIVVATGAPPAARQRVSCTPFCLLCTANISTGSWTMVFGP